MIDSVCRRHTKTRDPDEELVHPLTVCPNSDATTIVVSAHQTCSSERDTVSEALQAVREVKRSAMNGTESAPSLEGRKEYGSTRGDNSYETDMALDTGR